MAMTYEITGVPWLAVRVGRALETWGTSAARRIEHDDLVLRFEAQKAYEAARDARQSAYTGVYSILR